MVAVPERAQGSVPAGVPERSRRVPGRVPAVPAAGRMRPAEEKPPLRVSRSGRTAVFGVSGASGRVWRGFGRGVSGRSVSSDGKRPGGRPFRRHCGRSGARGKVRAPACRLAPRPENLCWEPNPAGQVCAAARGGRRCRVSAARPWRPSSRPVRGRFEALSWSLQARRKNSLPQRPL